jgi:CheY-like chemotaxis protein
MASASHYDGGMEGVTPHPRIILVDDNTVVRDMLIDLVASLGYAADAAESGEEALALFDQEPYDMVLTDLLMPGLTGWDVLDGVRRRDPSIPVIIITGSPVIGDARASQPGVAVVKKPVDVKLLDSLIKRMLRQRQPA